MQPKRVEMCAALWAEGIKAEFGYKPTIKDALGYADDNGIPFIVLFCREQAGLCVCQGAASIILSLILCGPINN